MKSFAQFTAPLCLFAGVMLMDAPAQGQYRTGGVGFGNVYGSAGARNPFISGGAGYGYGGYGGYGGYAGNRYANAYRPTFIYRSPESLARDPANDPYNRATNLTTLERSIRRFQDLREDSRSAREHYSNESYREDNPFDEFYYLRMMTP